MCVSVDEGVGIASEVRPVRSARTRDGVVERHLMWMLGAELRSSARVVLILNS